MRSATDPESGLDAGRAGPHPRLVIGLLDLLNARGRLGGPAVTIRVAALDQLTMRVMERLG